MAVTAANNPTLLDLAKATDPDGSPAAVAEILAETNDVLREMTVTNGNLTTGHRASVRTGLPTPTWRKIGAFVTPTKGTQAQIDFACGNLEAYGEVDKDLVELAPDQGAFRLSEDRAHIEGMNIEMADTLFYGNEASASEEFTGFSAHYNDLSAANADNIINAAGDSDYRSIWLVCWSPETIFGIVPKNSVAGLTSKDLGVQLIQSGADETNGSAGRMQAYVSHYQWKLGLVVKDWRYAVRIANIDYAAISTTYTAGAFSAGPDLPSLMHSAKRRIPNLSMGRCAWYMSRDMIEKLEKQLAAKTQNSTLTTMNVGGVDVESFGNIPIARTDALAGIETAVS